MILPPLESLLNLGNWPGFHRSPSRAPSTPPEKVAPKTLEKVQKAIALTGYVPNLLAGGLASRRSRLIAAIMPSIANSVYAETIKFFGEKMRDAGYQVLFGESGYSEEQEESLIATIF